MLVAFASTVEFLMSVVYTGPDPIAKHQSLSPGYARTTGAGTGSIILGEANDRKKKLGNF